MANPRRVQALLDMAEEDLASARILLEASIRHARYHAQQGAEKAVKALLEHRSLNPGREHRLGSLAEMFAQEDEWRVRARELDSLSPAATSLRYPTAEGRILPAPSRERVAAEIAKVATLVRDVRKAVGTDTPETEPVTSPEP